MRASLIVDSVKAKMRERGLDAAQVAEACGIAASTVSRILNGKVGTIDDRTAEKIERWLGKSLQYTMSAPAPMVIRENGELADDILKLSIWIRNNPQAWPFVLNAARGCGYKEQQ